MSAFAFGAIDRIGRRSHINADQNSRRSDEHAIELLIEYPSCYKKRGGRIAYSSHGGDSEKTRRVKKNLGSDPVDPVAGKKPRLLTIGNSGYESILGVVHYFSNRVLFGQRNIRTGCKNVTSESRLFKGCLLPTEAGDHFAFTLDRGLFSHAFFKMDVQGGHRNHHELPWRTMVEISLRML